MKNKYFYLVFLLSLQSQVFAQTTVADQIKKLVPKPVPQS